MRTFNAPDPFSTLLFPVVPCPGRALCVASVNRLLCPVASSWILLMGGTTKWSGVWDKVPVGSPWVALPSAEGRSSAWVALSIGHCLWALVLLLSLLFFKPRSSASPADCLFLVCHLFPDDRYWQWQLLILPDKNRNHLEEKKENVTRRGQEFLLHRSGK